MQLIAAALVVGTGALLIWTWAGFPVCLGALALVHRRRERMSGVGNLPCVSVIVTAHNEQDVIESRLRNLLASDYPAERLEIVVASDHSTDDTVELARGIDASRVRVIESSRRGKS